MAGFAVTAAGLVLFGLLGRSVATYGWLSIVSCAVAAGAALALARAGDRGAATGVAAATGLGLAVAMGVVALRWATTGWPLW
jgi:hypothetical protein